MLNPVARCNHPEKCPWYKVLGRDSLREVCLFFLLFLVSMNLFREQIAHWMGAMLDEATDPWGVKVERVEM